jgi:hypothetical protein
MHCYTHPDALLTHCNALLAVPLAQLDAPLTTTTLRTLIPGGSLVFDQSRNSDISASFHSHHLGRKHVAVLKEFQVVTPTDPARCITPHGYSFHEDGFFQTVRRVRNACLTLFIRCFNARVTRLTLM